MDRNYYYRLYQKEIEEIRKEGRRPSLLLHVCCAVCACDLLLSLSEVFDVTIFYQNDNIYPAEEYQHRLDELIRYLEWYHEHFHYPIQLIVPKYHQEYYMAEMQPYLHLEEFSERCWNCYDYRMEKAFAYADEYHYDYFTTVMSVSRYKNAQKINEIGEELQKRYSHTRYLYADFKKDKGEERSNALSKDLNLYRQPYCGCMNSLEEYRQRKNETAKNAVSSLSLE